MESDDERIMLLRMKEEIGRITGEILDLYEQFEKGVEMQPEHGVAARPVNAGEITRRIKRVVSLLESIARSGAPERDMADFNRLAAQIVHYGDLVGYRFVKIHILIFCSAADAVAIEDIGNGLRVDIPGIAISSFRTDIPLHI